MRRLVILTLSLLVIAPELFGADLYKMIQEGRISEANDSLSRIVTAATRDGDLIFFQSLIEPDADRAAELMEAALNAKISPTYRQQVYFRLANYYLIKRDYPKLSRVVNEYRAAYEEGAYEQEMLRLSVLADELQGNLEMAQRQADRYSVRYSSGTEDQWGRLDRARIMIANKKNIGAERLLRQLSREKNGVGVPQSLYLLAQDAIRNSHTEDAVYFYNLLKEAYPAAIGLESLSDQLAALSESYSTGNSAELLTGTYYTIQEGVYSQKENAERQAARFKDAGYKITIGNKEISGKSYFVVYIGRYRDYEEAAKVKRVLEASQGEVYQVIAR